MVKPKGWTFQLFYLYTNNTTNRKIVSILIRKSKNMINTD